MPMTGFVYASGPGLFDNAQLGAVIAKDDDQPPWIVVTHKLDEVVPTPWPGKLWHVQIIDRLEPQGHIGNYTRALAVEVIREVETSLIFGEHGDAVSRVIDAAMLLDKDQAKALMSERSPLAADLYSLGWTRWLDRAGVEEMSDRNDFTGVLAVSSQKSKSPIGSGLTLIHRHVFNSAQREAGDAALRMDSEDVWLADPWSQASNTLCEAALALGAPALFEPGDAAALLLGWNTVFRS